MKYSPVLPATDREDSYRVQPMLFFRWMVMLFWLWEISLRKLIIAEFHINGRCLGVFTWINPVQVWGKNPSYLSYHVLVSSDCIAEAWGDVTHSSLCYSKLSCSWWTVGEPLCTSERTRVFLDWRLQVPRHLPDFCHRKWTIHFLQYEIEVALKVGNET